eukprot:GGOE01036620.1.p1 GENE.GGOE01036620.1~~GGOE01036620.1.p1  ORF type:complete len:400 (+),score=77.56 GGOE01036620.1:67-1266(+)
MDVDDVLSKVRRMAIGRGGLVGIRSLGIRLRSLEASGRGQVAESNLRQVLSETGISLQDEEMRLLMSHFSAGHGPLLVDAFMDGVCRCLNARRRRVLDQAFATVDVIASGWADLDSLRAAHNAARHPQVLQGKRKAREIEAEFDQAFNPRTNPRGRVSYLELYEFYAGVSATVDEDAVFEELVRAVWDLDRKPLTATLGTTRTIPTRATLGQMAFTDTGKTYLRQYGAVDRPTVFMDILISGEQPERVVIELFSDFAPKTCENFRALCTGERGLGLQGRPLSYKGLKFHRIVPRFCIQSGDVVHNNGTGGESIYGKHFDDETFAIPFTEAGLVAMANNGPNTNSSQFFFVMKEARYLNDRHVVLGRVVENFAFLKRLERFGSDSGLPLKEVLIVDCGQL